MFLSLYFDELQRNKKSSGKQTPEKERKKEMQGRREAKYVLLFSYVHQRSVQAGAMETLSISITYSKVANGGI